MNTVRHSFHRHAGPGIPFRRRGLRARAKTRRPARIPAVILVWLLVFLAGGVGARAQVVSSLKQHDVDRPIEAAARTQVLLEKENLAVLEGDAEIRQGDLTLRADRILIHYDKDAPKDRSPVERVEARGHVRLASPSEKVRAEWGIYDVRGRLISLGGSVRLERAGNVLEGARMEIDLDDGLIRLAGDDSGRGGKGRVFGRFRAPVEGGQEKPTAAPDPTSSGADGDAQAVGDQENPS